MAVNFYFEEIKRFPFKVRYHKAWIKSVSDSYSKLLGDINIIFCSDEYLLKMNNEFLSHDYYTDVITFDYCEGDLISGDIFISIDRVSENAITNNVSYSIELQRVIIHGFLHLVGFHDSSDILKQRMTTAENLALSLLYTVK